MIVGSDSEKKYVDFHIHTKHSDGTCTVQEIIDMAACRNLAAIAITDHDCIEGYFAGHPYGASKGIEVISGLEMSSELSGVDIHILGFFVDVNNALLTSRLAELKVGRFERARRIVENLNRQGIDLRFETVLTIAGGASIGRPHIASAMLKEELAYSFREAFDKYIGYSSPAYVEKQTMHPKEVFELIRHAGGIPILAHPGVTNVDERIPQFVEDGLMGIEVYHSEHTPSHVKHYKSICKKHNLLMSGGSDFHSAAHSKSEIGVPRIPYDIILEMRAKNS